MEGSGAREVREVHSPASRAADSGRKVFSGSRPGPFRPFKPAGSPEIRETRITWLLLFFCFNRDKEVLDFRIMNESSVAVNQLFNLKKKSKASCI